jgi:hypothetical protein
MDTELIEDAELSNASFWMSISRIKKLFIFQKNSPEKYMVAEHSLHDIAKILGTPENCPSKIGCQKMTGKSSEAIS